MASYRCFVVTAGLLLAAGAGAAGQSKPAGDAASEPITVMGCVTGGNLQPVEQPFLLVPSEPFVLADVVTMTSEKAPTDYEVTGINLTPWLGMRVKVEGVLVPPAAAKDAPAAGGAQRPVIKARQVHSIWGTCPSPPNWTPAKLPEDL